MLQYHIKIQNNTNSQKKVRQKYKTEAKQTEEADSTTLNKTTNITP